MLGKSPKLSFDVAAEKILLRKLIYNKALTVGIICVLKLTRALIFSYISCGEEFVDCACPNIILTPLRFLFEFLFETA